MHHNLYHDIPRTLPTELIDIIAETGAVRIERIVSHGHTSDPDVWYDQDTDEFVLLLSGKARLAFADHTLDLHPGDYLIIKAHQKHRVVWTDPQCDTIWLAVHYETDK